MRKLQEWMGHANLKTTLIYADYAPGSDDANSWVNQAFSPRPALSRPGEAADRHRVMQRLLPRRYHGPDHPPTRERENPAYAGLSEGWTTGFEPATAWTTNPADSAK